MNSATREVKSDLNAHTQSSFATRHPIARALLEFLMKHYLFFKAVPTGTVSS